MSTLIISRGIYPDQVGGLEVQVSTLYNYLTDKNHNVRLLTRLYNEHIEIKGNEKMLLYKYNKNSFFKFFSFIVFGFFQAIKNRRQYDVIFSFGPDQASIIALFVNVLLGKPYIISLRSEKHLEYGNIKSLFFKLLLSRASLTHVQTEDIRKNLFSRYGTNYKTIKIPNIVNAHIKETIDFSDRKYDLIFVGNRESNKDYNKGSNIFLEICNNFKSKLKIICIGNIVIPEEIERRHNFVVHNRVSREVLIDFFSQSKLQICCSESEGMPNVIIEAMTVGTPTISTNVGGIPNVIVDGKNGILLKKPDSRMFVKVIKKNIS